MYKDLLSKTMSSRLGPMKMLIALLFFAEGVFRKWKTGEGRAGTGEEEETERFYWLVSSSSVDGDEFNCGTLRKADATPDQPPSSCLPLCLFPLSFSCAPGSRSMWSDIKCLLRANGYMGCVFVLCVSKVQMPRVASEAGFDWCH